MYYNMALGLLPVVFVIRYKVPPPLRPANREQSVLLKIHVQVEFDCLLQELTPAQISAAKQKFNYYDKVKLSTCMFVVIQQL